MLTINQVVASYIGSNITQVVDACICTWNLERGEVRQFGSNDKFWHEFHEKNLLTDCSKLVRAKNNVVYDSVSRRHNQFLGKQATKSVVVSVAHQTGYDEGIFVVPENTVVNTDLIRSLYEHTAIMCSSVSQATTLFDVPNYDLVIKQHQSDLRNAKDARIMLPPVGNYTVGDITLSYHEFVVLSYLSRRRSLDKTAIALQMPIEEVNHLAAVVMSKLHALNLDELFERAVVHGFDKIIH